MAALLKPHKAGRLVNQIKMLAEDIAPLPRVERSPDPTGDFLLALSEGGQADYLVTGDKSGLLPSAITKGRESFLRANSRRCLLEPLADERMNKEALHEEWPFAGWW